MEEQSLFLEPARVSDLFGAGLLSKLSDLEIHHPQDEPMDHLCTCGKVREACVHDEIRALWT